MRRSRLPLLEASSERRSRSTRAVPWSRPLAEPSSKGAKVSFAGGKPQVIDGPFAETKELIAGYWLIQVKSKAEAIEWAKRIPFEHLPHDARAPEVEIRQMFELTDFPDIPADVAEMERSFASNRTK